MSTSLIATIQRPETIDITIELTLPLGEWKKIAAALTGVDYWPCGKLAGELKDVIHIVTAQVVKRIEGIE